MSAQYNELQDAPGDDFRHNRGEPARFITADVQLSSAARLEQDWRSADLCVGEQRAQAMRRSHFKCSQPTALTVEQETQPAPCSAQCVLC